MKEMMKKISGFLKKVFGYGIMTALFGGGLSFFGYLAALIVGGPAAEAICAFVYKQFLPVMVYLSTVMILVGLIAMYLGGEFALTPGKKNKQEKKEQ